MSTFEWSVPPLALSEEELAENLLHVGKQGPRGGMVLEVDGLLCVKIPLTKGKFALVDFEDYEDVGRYRWYAIKPKASSTWYARRNIDGANGKPGTLGMHQQILQFQGLLIDHKNRNGLDNRRSNLRAANCSQNTQNQKGHGVPWIGVRHRTKNCWQARIGNQYHYQHLGSYPTPELAARAYDAKAIELYGQNARLNFPA